MHASNANAGFPNHSEEYPPSCSPRDVRNDYSIRPEVDIGGLAVVCEVLDVDGLLVQDEDVPGHAVRGPGEGAQVQGLVLVLAPAQAGQRHHAQHHAEQGASLEMRIIFLFSIMNHISIFYSL